VDLDPHLHPHQSDELDPDPHQFADDVWTKNFFEHFFKVLSLYLDPDRIKVKGRIRIKVTRMIRIRNAAMAMTKSLYRHQDLPVLSIESMLYSATMNDRHVEKSRIIACARSNL
jgi:hypothetical protein